MAELGGNFDATSVDPSEEWTLLPDAEYVAMITESEMKETNDGTGRYLKLKFQISDGEYSGRILFANLNIQNRNEKAVEIALRDLSAICHAVNKLNIQNSEELHDLPMVVKVKIRPARVDKATGNEYPASNEIKAFKKIGSSVENKPPSTTQKNPPGRAAGPWSK